MGNSASRSLDHKHITTMPTGADISLAIHTITGSEPGPRFVIFGGIHGDEATAVEAVRRIVEAVDEKQLKGTLVAVPVSNPYAYESMTRHTTQDGHNLNRIFPGDAGGSLTEQLAAALVEIQKGADYFIDFHSSGLYSTVDYAYVHTGAEVLAKAYGTPLLYHHEPYSGSSAEMMLSAGVPAMVSELGGGGQKTTEFLDRSVAGTLNVLRTVGMLPGDPVDPPEQKVMTKLITLRPTKGGAVISEYGPDALGSVVPGGTVLGRVVNPHTFEVEEELVAPFDETIIVLTREQYTRCAPGDYGFMVGDNGSLTTVDAI